MKTTTLIATMLFLISSTGLQVASADGPAIGVPGVVGLTKQCKCEGAGRTATCDAPCTCDYDWQGYPRCTSGGRGFDALDALT